MGEVKRSNWDDSEGPLEFIEGHVICRVSPSDDDSHEHAEAEFDEWIRDDFPVERSDVLLPPGWVMYKVIESEAEASTLEMIDAINRSDRVFDGFDYGAFPDGLMRNHTAPPNDELFPEQWGLKSVGVTDAWDCTKGSPEVWLAIVDSGIPVVHDTSLPKGRLVHEDLDDTDRFKFGLAHEAGLPLAGPPFFEEFSNYGTTPGQLPTDKVGHGTHVLGIMAAKANDVAGRLGGGTVGVNWVSPVYVTAMEQMIGANGQAQGNGASQLASAIFELASWMVNEDQRQVVVNISLGGKDFSNGLVRAAIELAVDAGAVIVASTGNSFTGATPNCGGDVCAPASYATVFPHGVISVGATEPGSGSGPVVAPWSNPQAGLASPGPVTVVAPGSNIHSTTYLGGIADWGAMDGTSQAAPLVAGIVSLYWSTDPDLTNAQVVQAVKDTADPVGPDTLPHPRWGFGVINAKALICDVAGEVLPPVDTDTDTDTEPDTDLEPDTNVGPKALCRTKVKYCAGSLSHDVLAEILDENNCESAGVDSVAASLWLREWLGDKAWSG